MPRGNLEAVAPRMLVLAAIATALQERDYATAWELATTNRVGASFEGYGWRLSQHTHTSVFFRIWENLHFTSHLNMPI